MSDKQTEPTRRRVRIELDLEDTSPEALDALRRSFLEGPEGATNITVQEVEQ